MSRSVTINLIIALSSLKMLRKEKKLLLLSDSAAFFIRNLTYFHFLFV